MLATLDFTGSEHRDNHISSNNSRGQLFEGNIVQDHWKSCLNLFSFIIPLNKKNITSNKLNMGIIWFPDYSQSLNHQ